MATFDWREEGVTYPVKHTCNCANPEKNNWVVTQRNCTKQSFAGMLKTSKFSTVVCNVCRRRWRTSAKYVESIRDANPAEKLMLI